MKQAPSATGKDIGTLIDFIVIYCENTHEDRSKRRISAKGDVGSHVNRHGAVLCEECERLLLHAASKRLICPYDPKPSCKRCPTHCYAPVYRDQIRTVMRFSGKHLIRHGRLDLLIKYFA